MPSVPAFLIAPVAAPEPLFDPHFGFSTGASTDASTGPDAGGPQAASSDTAGDAGAGRRQTLATACAALSEAARALGALDQAERLAALPTLVDDATDPRYTAERSAYFHGSGIALLHALANAAMQACMPAGLRREELVGAVDDLDLCTTGRHRALMDRLHRLGSSPATAAALRRDDLIRQTLREVVRASLGRDPAEGHRTLANFEVHYVAALERRLKLPSARDLPEDEYFDATTLSRDVLTRATLTLQQRVTPAAIVRSLAEEVLEGVRAGLMAADVDLGRIWPATKRQQQAIDRAIHEVEGTLGVVNRWALFREDADSGRAGLVTQPHWLAVEALRNLMSEGEVSQRAIETRLTWCAPDASPCRLRCLTDGLWWVQTGQDEGFNPGEARLVRVGILLEFDRLMARGRHPLMSAEAREGLARMPILYGTEDALPRIAPHWLVDEELTRHWWRRMGEHRCGAWLDRHQTAALHPDLGSRLMLAADDAGHGALFARLLPGKETGAALAWTACDGAGRLAEATRCGDVDRVRRWLALLTIAMPALSARSRGQALVARADGGQSALACAMALPRGGELVRELVTTVLAVRGSRPEAWPRAGQLSLSPPFHEILAGGEAQSLGAIGVALAHGEAESLQVFLDAVEGAHERGLLTRPELRAMVVGVSDHFGPGHWEGFRLAMRRNHADAVAVWTQALIRIARDGALDEDELFDALKVLHEDGSDVYHAAMCAGACEAAARYREVLHTARVGGLLKRDQVERLLIGHPAEPHALSQAAAAGHVRAVVEHLRDEPGLLGLLTLRRFFDGGGLAQARWCRRGGHVAIGAAMRKGQTAVVAVLAAHALDLQRRGWRPSLFPSFAGLPGDAHALDEAVMAGHLEAVRLWMGALAQGVTEGWIGGRDMLALMAAKDDRDVPLLHRAASTLDPERLSTLLQLTVEAVCLARLGSWALRRLLGPGRRHPSLLAAALLADRACAVRLVGQCLLHLRDDNALTAADLRQLLVLRGRSRWFGRRGARVVPGAGQQWSPVTADAYVSLVECARSRGWIDKGRARDCLRGWAGTPGRPVDPEGRTR